jgi:rhamnopyranosyl-N-acetylglucosaminyl-diphospho-decaprenol beta-1,3/1,4-galactofuranosyltransferase
MKPSTVCTVVVTFNRKKLLRECLTALSVQTRPSDCVIVLDNHSTDGTPAMVAGEFPAFTLINLPENMGGSGGFYEGVKWAWEHGYEWIWVMDDDVEPFPETLRRMLTYTDVSKFIHVRRRGPEGVISLEAVWDLNSCYPMQYGQDISFAGDPPRPWISLTYGNFEGALIHRDIPSAIGFPDARFFVGGDDTIYGYLASFHTNVILASEVGFSRALYVPTKNSRMSYYLGPRNRFLMREHLRGTGVKLDDRTFWFNMLRLVFWSVRDAARGFPPGWRNNAMAAIKGMSDGMRGRFGRPPWIPA